MDPMTIGPPFSTDDTDTEEWPNWREETTLLDKYPNREIRIIFPADQYDSISEHKVQPADFGDFSPKNSDPDPDVWPLKGYDPGAPAPVYELYRWAGTFPAPHVAWVTEELLTERYGYNPVKQRFRKGSKPEENPNLGPHLAHKQDLTTHFDPAIGAELFEVDATNPTDRTLKLNDTRLEALDRIGRMWNGEIVQGQHLLWDKCPSWGSFLGDLDQNELKRFVIDPDINYQFANAFGQHSWYDEQFDVYMKPQRILRKKVWYSPTMKGKTLLQNRVDLPTLRGDQFERLRHRVGVGLLAVLEKSSGGEPSSYETLGPYVVDLFSKPRSFVFEFITDHNNTEELRNTYHKIRDLHDHGYKIAIGFDTRSTAYSVFNYWHNQDLATLPNGPFNSEFPIDKGQDAIRDAYTSNEDWVVSHWFTSTSIWDRLIGEDNPAVNKELVTSIKW